MKKIFKKTVLVDLDGVLNTYAGDYQEDFIPPIKVGANNFLCKLDEIFKIVIFTTRNKDLVMEWLISNNIDKYISRVTNEKEPAFLIIDDRCLQFNGNYDETLKQIENFKVWYK